MKKHIKNYLLISIIILIFVGLQGCIEETGSDRFIGTWELIDAEEIVMILNEDGTTNVWNDPVLAERVGDNYTSKWSIVVINKQDWIIFNYNFTTYEKNFRFTYKFKDNGDLIFTDTTYNIDFVFRKM